MDLAAVMDDVANRARTIATLTGGRTHAQPPAKITPPAFIVSYPDDIDPHATYARGMARMTLPAVLVVDGRLHDKATRDRLSAYCKGSGASSILAVLESGTYSAFDSLTVLKIEFDVVTINATEYLAALFTLDIGGSGTS